MFVVVAEVVVVFRCLSLPYLVGCLSLPLMPQHGSLALAASCGRVLRMIGVLAYERVSFPNVWTCEAERELPPQSKIKLVVSIIRSSSTALLKGFSPVCDPLSKRGCLTYACLRIDPRTRWNFSTQLMALLFAAAQSHVSSCRPRDDKIGASLLARWQLVV